MSISSTSSVSQSHPLLSLPSASRMLDISKAPKHYSVDLDRAALAHAMHPDSFAGATTADLAAVQLDTAASLPYPANAAKDDVKAWHKLIVRTAESANAKFEGILPMGTSRPLTLTGLAKALDAKADGLGKAQQYELLCKRATIGGGVAMGSAAAAVCLGFHVAGAVVGVAGFVSTFLGGMEWMVSASGSATEERSLQGEARTAARLVEGWNAQLGS